jgi:hypothetical protein
MKSKTVSVCRRVRSPLFAIVVLLLGKNLLAQPCSPANTPPMFDHGWSKGRSVSVYIDSSFTPDQYNAIAGTFNNWTAANASSNNSQVTYTFTSNQAGADFTVFHTPPTANPGVRGETVVSTDWFDHTIHAETRLNTTETDPAVLAEVMVHEIGHPEGLGDCLTCDTSASVMGRGAPLGNHLVGRPTSPTPCDNASVQSNYPNCIPPVFSCDSYDANTCTCAGLGVGNDAGVYNKQEIGSCTDWYLVTWVSYNSGATWNFYSAVYLGCW